MMIIIVFLLFLKNALRRPTGRSSSGLFSRPCGGGGLPSRPVAPYEPSGDAVVGTRRYARRPSSPRDGRAADGRATAAARGCGDARDVGTV